MAPNINPAPGNRRQDPCGDPGSNWHSLRRRGSVTVPGGQGPGASSGVLNLDLVRRIVSRRSNRTVDSIPSSRENS